MTTAYERAYYAPKRADDRYQMALEREHGRAAGDVRYMRGKQSAAVRKLGAAKRRADEKMRRELEKQRAKSNPKGRTKFDRCVKAVKRSGSAADPRAVCGAARKKRKNSAKRKNSVPAAQDRYERFHGHPSKELIEVKEKLHYHSALSALGDLKKLVIQPEKGPRVVIKNFKGAFLAQNEAATQLYIVGGDQAVDLADFGIRKPVHEKEVLGRCLRVYYFTTKDHLMPQDGGTAVYNHAFGRNKPTIVYDTVNHLLEFAGGGYTIPDEGIDG